MRCRWHDRDFWRAIYPRGYAGQDRAAVYERRVRRLRESLDDPLLSGTTLVVGCGLGQMIPLLPDAWGVEFSDYLWDEALLGSSVLRERIAYADIRNLDSVERDLVALGAPSRFDRVVTDDMIMSFEENELAGVLANCERLAFDRTGVVHVLSYCLPRVGDSTFLQLTEQEWRQAAPHHTWVIS